MISDPWIDRDWRKPVKVKPPRVLKTEAVVLELRRERRQQLVAANKCINGPLIGNVGKSGLVHGEVYKANRCEHCYSVKLDSDDRANERRIARAA